MLVVELEAQQWDMDHLCTHRDAETMEILGGDSTSYQGISNWLIATQQDSWLSGV